MVSSACFHPPYAGFLLLRFHGTLQCFPSIAEDLSFGCPNLAELWSSAPLVHVPDDFQGMLQLLVRLSQIKLSKALQSDFVSIKVGKLYTEKKMCNGLL